MSILCSFALHFLLALCTLFSNVVSRTLQGEGLLNGLDPRAISNTSLTDNDLRNYLCSSPSLEPLPSYQGANYDCLILAPGKILGTLFGFRLNSDLSIDKNDLFHAAAIATDQLKQKAVDTGNSFLPLEPGFQPPFLNFTIGAVSMLMEAFPCIGISGEIIAGRHSRIVPMRYSDAVSIIEGVMSLVANKAPRDPFIGSGYLFESDTDIVPVTPARDYAYMGRFYWYSTRHPAPSRWFPGYVCTQTSMSASNITE